MAEHNVELHPSGIDSRNHIPREDLENYCADLSPPELIQSARPNLQRTLSHGSHHEIPSAMISPSKKYAEQGDEIYDRFSLKRKIAITTTMSICSLLAPLASTTVLSAIPEVAAEFNTTGSIIGLSNALYMLFMGLCAISWGPMGTVFGRRKASHYPVILKCCGCSIGAFREVVMLMSGLAFSRA